MKANYSWRKPPTEVFNPDQSNYNSAIKLAISEHKWLIKQNPKGLDILKEQRQKYI